MFSWLIRWAGSDLGTATEAIFKSVSIRNSTLPIKSLWRRCLLALAVLVCFCSWPHLLTWFLLLAFTQLEQTQGCLHRGLPCTISFTAQRHYPRGTSGFWPLAFESQASGNPVQKELLVQAHISALAYGRYTGRQWTWPRCPMKVMCI